MRDHYQTLQVTRDAEQAVIERAYKALSMSRHPDRVSLHDRQGATVEMQRLNEAYSVLSDPIKRAAYDSTLPRESTKAAWDLFMDDGLVGLFLDKFGRR